MRKILHVVGKMHYGGMETLIMNLYRHIDKEKIQFDILVYYTETGEYDEEVRQLGGNVYVVEKSTNPIKYLCKLAAFFAEHHDYNAIHVHVLWLAWIYFLFAQKYKIKKILHIHAFGTDYKGLHRLMHSNFKKKSVKSADVIFACSRRAALYHRSDQSKTYVLKNGIDGKQFYYNEVVREKIRLEFGLEQKKVIICTARFNIQKNHTFLIDILEQLVKRDKNVVLLLVGKGPLENSIKQKVKALGLNSYVKFLGARDDVNRLLQGVDAYVMPSLYEGLGIVYIEAQAAGVKTFASDEAYTNEAHISNLFLHRPIADGEEEWADWILQNIEYKRENKEAELIKSGFEIRAIAYALQQFYLGVAGATDLFEKL